jgi:hypothetical protein
MGALALFLVIAGGTAYAANTVGSADIINESIQSQDIKNGQVRSPDIGNNQVSSADVRDDALGNGGLDAADLSSNSVNSSEIVADAVQASEVADDSLDSGEIVNNSLTTADLAGADVTGGISFGAVPDGQCFQVSLGVGGAQVGEVPLIATGGALQEGVVIYAERVQSAGNVQAEICNFSGGAMTPLTDFPVEVVTFG